MSLEHISADYTELQAAQRLRQEGELAEAKRICRRIAERSPDNFAALYSLAAICFQLGEMETAAETFGQAHRINPAFANAAFHRGVALNALDRHEEAVESYRAAIEQDRAHLGALQNLISSLIALKRPRDALQACAQALAIQQSSDLFDTQAIILNELGRPHEALASHDRAVDLDALSARAHYNRGRTFSKLTSYDDALACFDRAIELRPDYAAAHLQRGLALNLLERREEALQSCNRAVELCPDYPSARLDRGLLLLLLGRFEEGWRNYEWRKKLPDPIGLRASTRPEWTGESDISGQTLLIDAEQGRGDIIQFFRFAQLAEQRGAKVIVAVDRCLFRLLGSMAPSIAFIEKGAEPAAFDRHCAMMSLPLAFKVTPENTPASIPYLCADADRTEHWKDRIGDRGFKIGVVWQGARTPLDAGRSFPLQALDTLARTPGVRLISLQKGDGVEQLGALPHGMTVESLGDDYDSGPDAFLDCAAAMMSLDLIITSDTAAAHLAGALGRPVWVALQRVPDWRWMLERDDSPWYPTLRLFRQQARGDWAGVFKDMHAALVSRLEADGP